MGAENLSPEFVTARETCLEDIKDIRDEYGIDHVGGSFPSDLEWEEGKGTQRTMVLFLSSGIVFIDYPMQSPAPRHPKSDRWLFLKGGSVLHTWLDPERPPLDVAIRNHWSEDQDDLSEEGYRLANELQEVIREPKKLDGLRFKLQQLNPAKAKS